MTRYMLSIYQPDGPTPSPEALAPVMRELDALNQELKATGAWVFTAGLHEPGTATVVRLTGGEVLTTDGPFAEGKEHVGGFTIIQAPDLDDALRWASRMARALSLDPAGTGLAIEVRPLRGSSGA